MCASKKANIILSDVLLSPPLIDAGIVTLLPLDELSINATVVRCSCLSKPSVDVSRSCHFLATLSSNADALAAIRLAAKLREFIEILVRDYVKIKADLTPEQRKLDYGLHTELKRRRAAGNHDLVIRDNKLIVKSRSWILSSSHSHISYSCGVV